MRLTIPSSVISRLVQELRKARRCEIGGLLFGEHVGSSEFRIADVSVQHDGGSNAHFVRDPAQHQAQLDAFFERTGHDYVRFNYLGEWHSHPSFMPIPSEEDMETMRAILVDPKVGVNFLVLMIVRLNRCSVELSATGFVANAEFPIELSIEEGETQERWTFMRWLYRKFNPSS